MATIRDCNKIQPFLSEYVDGTLSDQDTWDVQMHVASCGVCDRIAQDFAATKRLLQAAPIPELSARFETMLAQRIADKSLRPLPLTPWQKLWFALVSGCKQPRTRHTLATAAALVVLAPVAFMATRWTTPPVKPTPVAVGGSLETTLLDELWREHRAYDSSEPLSNPSGLLPVSSSDGFGS